MITDKEREEARALLNEKRQNTGYDGFVEAVAIGISCIRAESAKQATKEARERIKEMSQTLLTISQYPIAFVCEDVRTLARNEWEKSKEYVE